MKKLLRLLVFVPIMVLFALSAPSPAMAAELRSGDTVIIASGDVVNDDLYVAASRIIINGTVNGDVLGVGENLTVTGTINGSLTAIGGTIGVSGEVTRSVRAVGQTVNVGGMVGGDVMVAGADLELSRSGTVGRDFMFAAQKVYLDGQIEESVKGTAETVNLTSVVGQDVELEAANLTIASSAKIGGNLVYASEKEARIEPGAVISGTTTRNEPRVRDFDYPYLGWWFGLVGYLMTLVTGCVIILLFPRRAAAVAASIKREPWLSLGWGAIVLFAAPIAILIVMITVIGIPLGLLGVAAYIITLYLSQVAAGLFLGYWILGSFARVESRGMLVGAFALGFTIITLVGLIPVVGFLAGLAAALFGIGAMVLSYRHLNHHAVLAQPAVAVK